MSLENKLESLLSGIESDRVTERKKCGESLKDLLSRTELPKILSENHRKDSGKTWKSLFVTVHDLVIKESDKLSSGRTASLENVISLCSTLLYSVISGANKNSCFVQSDRLIECSLEILRSTRYSQYFGETYINLITKHILTSDHYLENLTPFHWADLLDIGYECSEISHIKRSLSVGLILKVLKTGITRCHLVLPVRDNLQALTKLFTDYNNDSSHILQENLLEISIIAVENVSCESRLSFCLFTETVIPQVLKFYDQTSDTFKQKKELLFKFLRVSIAVHHPGHHFGNQPGCLAGNWSTWNAILNSVHQLVIAEATFLDQIYKRSNQHIPVQLCIEYVLLAVESCHQIFNRELSNDSVDGQEDRPTKRFKIEHNEVRTLEELLSCITEYPQPWISVIGSYLKKYGFSLSEKRNILNFLCNFVTSNDSDGKCSSVYEVIGDLIKDFSQNEINSSLTQVLTLIWNTCIRKVTVNGVLFDHCHNIIQILLNAPGFEVQLNSLIKLYCEGSMPPSHSSLLTVNIMLSRHNTKLVDRNKRLQICQWVLKHYMASFSDNIIVHILFQLCIKENISLPDINKRSENNVLQRMLNSYEYIILLSDFENGILVDKKEYFSENNKELYSSISVWENICVHIMEVFNANICHKICDIKRSFILVPEIIIECDVLLKFISFFIEHKTLNSEKEFVDLKNNTNEAFYLIVNHAPRHLNNPSGRPNEVLNILKSLKKLYCRDHYSNEISLMIREKTTKELIESICSCLNENNDSMQVDELDDLDVSCEISNSAENKIKMTAMDIAITFCSMESTFRSEVLQFVVKEDLYDFKIKNDFDIALSVLSYILKNIPNDPPIGPMLRLIQNICRALFRNNEATFKVLSLLYEALDAINRLGTSANRDNCVIMLQGYLQRCNTHYYQPKVMGLAFKCYSYMLSQRHHPGWGSDLKALVMKNLMSNTHSIRLYSCYCLAHAMKEASQNDFDELVSLLPEIFNIENAELTPNIISDEGANRTATVFHCLASIAVTSPVWDKKALSAIIQMAHSKNISPSLITKVFQCIIEQLNVSSVEKIVNDNIGFLLGAWFEEKIPIQKFPYYLIGCRNEEDFYYLHRKCLVPLEMFWSINGKIGAVAQKVLASKNLSIEELFIDCLDYSLSLSLPYAIIEGFNNDIWNPPRHEILNGQNLLSTIVSTLGEGSAKKLIVNKLIDFFTVIMKQVCDKAEISRDLGWTGVLPYVNKPKLSKKTFHAIVGHLNEMLQIEVNLHLCFHNPAGLQQLLLTLWSNISCQHSLEGQLLCLHQYWIFCNTLPVDADLSPFMFSFIINSLLHIIKKCTAVEEFQYTGIAACKMLKDILQKHISSLESVICQYVSNIIYTVSQTVLKNPLFRDDGLSLINFLLIEHKDRLESAIKLLDPLPDADCFLIVNNALISNIAPNCSLQSQIENFLLGGLDGRCEGLKLLSLKLNASKTELASMFEKLKINRGFSEDCDQSVLHRLTCALLQIVSKKDDPEASVQACRCLGELGLSDYQTLVIFPPADTSDITNMTPLKYLSFTALCQLKDLIYDSNPEIVRAAAQAMISLLSYKEGIFILEYVCKQNNFPLLKKLLLPFMSGKKTFTSGKLIINDASFTSHFHNRDLWQELDEKGHTQWIVDLTTSVLKCFSEQNKFLTDLVEICQLKDSLPERLLPSIIGLLHSCGSQDQIDTIRQKVQNFFDNYFGSTFKPNNEESLITGTVFENVAKSSNTAAIKDFKSNTKVTKKSVQCMLELVQFVMLQNSHYSQQSSNIINSSKSCFPFDYLTIAWAACSTGAHFTAIYYAELWCTKKDLTPPMNPEKISALLRGKDLLSILRMSYLAIGDTDALHGCGSAHLLDPSKRTDHYMRMGSYSDALLMYDLDLAHKGQHSQTFTSSVSPVISIERGFVKSLQMSGLYHLARNYMKASDSENAFDDMKYECFWRLGDWSLQVDRVSLKDSATKESRFASVADCLKPSSHWPAHQYLCLKNCLSKTINVEDSSFQRSLMDARRCATVGCTQSSLGSSQATYELISKLQILQEIEYLAKVVSEQRNDNFTDLIMSWSGKNILPYSDFKHLEPIIAQRVVILGSMAKNVQNVETKIKFAELQLEYAELAMFNGWLQATTRWTNSASQIAQDILDCQNVRRDDMKDALKLVGCVRLTEGQAAWRGGHRDVALDLVRTLITNKDNVDDVLYANALRQYGSWMVETRSESILDIIDNYLKKSLDILGPGVNPNANLDSYIAIARFTDEEYKQLNSYIKSPAFTNKIRCMERCKETAQALDGMHNELKDIKKDVLKAMVANDGQSKIDKSEIINFQLERKKYLQLSLRYYLLTLSNGEENNLCVFRVVSLWLDNPVLELDGDSDKTLCEFFESIPSRKFLPLIPQLAPRLSQNTEDPFQDKLHKLIERCVIDHPHHVLPVLLALKNSNKDSKTGNGGEEPYILAAQKIIQSISSRGDGRLTNIVRQTETLSLAMISLANLKTPDNNEQIIPKSEPFRLLKQLPHVLVPTVTLPIRHDNNYRNIPSVVSFNQKFILVGGVNRPKKLICRGSDGIDRPMLLKGEDDIRQDAVMQQVFEIVNNLMASNQHTRHRKLLIRTYKVVALSRRSGVIEWCEGTEPLGQLLTGRDGTGGLHRSMRPKDITSREARQLMTSKNNAQQTNEGKLQVFKDILSKFKPVFHYFFLENFVIPAAWYERKLAYTHSVATSSMIGYILGLGDRHVQNILIDKTTAEVIHIDFGIAFEQGRVQRTPETVPFRLTQDVVAGLGAAGVEGVFRRSCEKTMDVLKANDEVLITILEVFLCDPLYMWTLSPGQEVASQSHVSNYNNIGTEGWGSEAERALLRVRSKLDGAEFGSTLATPGHVARLIQQATDINNLSRLFPGWQPFL